MMSKFGWDLPPGVTSRMIDEAAGVGEVCAVCCKDVDYCVCPKCTECQVIGDPLCYRAEEGGHGMRLTREQAIGRSEARMSVLDEKIADEKYYLDTLKEGGKFSDRIEDDPDPWR